MFVERQIVDKQSFLIRSAILLVSLKTVMAP
jgi:hypothetical protein